MFEREKAVATVFGPPIPLEIVEYRGQFLRPALLAVGLYKPIRDPYLKHWFTVGCIQQYQATRRLKVTIITTDNMSPHPVDYSWTYPDLNRLQANIPIQWRNSELIATFFKVD